MSILFYYRSTKYFRIGRSESPPRQDVIRESLFGRIYQACNEWKGWVGRGRFFERMDLVRTMMVSTIEYGWLIGFEPVGLPYAKCGGDFHLCLAANGARYGLLEENVY